MDIALPVCLSVCLSVCRSPSAYVWGQSALCPCQTTTPYTPLPPYAPAETYSNLTGAGNMAVFQTSQLEVKLKLLPHCWLLSNPPKQTHLCTSLKMSNERHLMQAVFGTLPSFRQSIKAPLTPAQVLRSQSRGVGVRDRGSVCPPPSRSLVWAAVPLLLSAGAMEVEERTRLMKLKMNQYRRGGGSDSRLEQDYQGKVRTERVFTHTHTHTHTQVLAAAAEGESQSREAEPYKTSHAVSSSF